MNSLGEHCWNLCRFTNGNDRSKKQWEQLYEYLNVSASIDEVKINLTKYDSNFGWCSAPDTWIIAREEILEKYTLQLLRFTYVWGGLEAIIDAINPKPSPEKGKINRICYYLLQKLHVSDEVSFYSAQLGRLNVLLNEADIREPSIKKRFKGNRHLSHQGLGIYVIYKLRNVFAHGALTFPEPEPYEHKPISSYPEMIEVSTRLVLLTIQMIFIAHLQSNPWDDYVGYDIFNDESVSPEEAIRRLHRKRCSMNEKQLKIC